jgi:hypothetical protein
MVFSSLERLGRVETLQLDQLHLVINDAPPITTQSSALVG